MTNCTRRTTCEPRTPRNLANTQHAPGQVIEFSSVQFGTWKRGRSSQKERIWSPSCSQHHHPRTKRENIRLHPTRAWSPRCSSGQTFFASNRNQSSIWMICNMETSCKPRFGGTNDTITLCGVFTNSKKRTTKRHSYSTGHFQMQRLALSYQCAHLSLKTCMAWTP